MKNIISIVVVILIAILIHSCAKNDNNSIRDVDGNIYTSVTIGTQVWLVENLKVTRYRNGDLIGTTIPSDLIIADEVTPKYQWSYNGDESNVATYGRLYTWYAITDIRGVCPTGWHIPGADEWNTLLTLLGGPDVAGGELKETGTTHWSAPNEGATNSSGFTALPGGGRGTTGFGAVGYGGFWWSSTECSPNGAYLRDMRYNGSEVTTYNAGELYGFSVRCLQDY
jgi:uncharacterized protein (TIGR02145 family)